MPLVGRTSVPVAYNQDYAWIIGGGELASSLEIHLCGLLRSPIQGYPDGRFARGCNPVNLAKGGAMTVGGFTHRGSHSHAVHFLRHLLEMTAAMVVGMVAGGAVFVTALGTTVDEAIREHPISFVLVMAASMTVPMVAWMRFRGHEWRSCTEMGAAMVIPAIALICLRMADVISAPICGFYCASTIIAMIGLMLYRRSDHGSVSAIAPR
jgi:hypothetical protein